jgi:site-specific DNA-methyltransferase (adenine-specific)
VTTTSFGDGQIVLHHGDCLPWLRSLPSASAQMLLTDIPYDEVNARNRVGGIRNIDKGAADVATFDLDEFIDECARVVIGTFYIFCGYRQVSPIVHAYDRHKLTVRVGAWQKSNPSPLGGQSGWVSGLEMCVYGRRKGSVFNEHCQPALWVAPSGRSKVHPTEKPLALFSRLVAASSDPGDVVLDPCMGSGTAAVAAYEGGRGFLGAELHDEFFALASGRLAASGACGDREADVLALPAPTTDCARCGADLDTFPHGGCFFLDEAA